MEWSKTFNELIGIKKSHYKSVLTFEIGLYPRKSKHLSKGNLVRNSNVLLNFFYIDDKLKIENAEILTYH